MCCVSIVVRISEEIPDRTSVTGGKWYLLGVSKIVETEIVANVHVGTSAVENIKVISNYDR